jgi:hypothetical protein
MVNGQKIYSKLEIGEYPEVNNIIEEIDRQKR